MGWDDPDNHVECNGAPFQKSHNVKYYMFNTHGGKDCASVANPFYPYSIIYDVSNQLSRYCISYRGIIQGSL